MDRNGLVTLRQEGDASWITLHRPPLNFLSRELLDQIVSQLESFGEFPACKALVLDSDLPAFSAGLEMSEINRDSAFLLLEGLHRLALTLCSFSRPTIAVVQGMALGAANELLACCDFVFASEKASFGQPEVKVGGIPSLASLLLPPLVGERRATEMILTGSLIGAAEAERIGLISRALPEGRVNAAVGELVKALGGLSTSVLEVALHSIRGLRSQRLQSHLRKIESLYLDQLMSLEDSMEGVSAFLEKRPPVWKNK